MSLPSVFRSRLGVFGFCALAGCTLYHSKQALYAEAPTGLPPSAAARFVSEEDSGLSVLGVFVLAEADHYAVLLERLRRDHRCARLLYPQLDFYTDHWLLIAFPIARVTSLCEPESADAGTPIPALPGAPGWHDGPAATPPASAPPESTPPAAIPPAAMPSAPAVSPPDRVP